VRLNGERVVKPARTVTVGDVLTFSQGRAVRIIRVAAIGERRGPASEARQLYVDLSEKSDDDDCGDRVDCRRPPDAPRVGLNDASAATNRSERKEVP
jgi:ribosome-associated heat shock protein Hsp15